MTSGLVAILLVAAISAPAHADDDTYCVGGYSGRPPFASMRCGNRAISRMHPRWHFHLWVRRGNQCFACWDEVDNSCETHFLRDNPRFRAVRDPLSECPQADTMDEVVVHMIHGRDVTPQPPPPPAPPAPPSPPDVATIPTRPSIPDQGNKPPRPTAPQQPAASDPGKVPPRPTAPPEPAAPPPPVELRARLDPMPPGPYASGETIDVQGSLRSPDGDVRGIPGGTFTVTTAEGDSFEVRGTVQPDGTVRASFPLPSSTKVSIAFSAMAPRLEPGERLLSAATAAQDLQVDVCSLRGRLVSPSAGSALAVGQATMLVAEITDRSGRLYAASASTLVFSLAPADGDLLTLNASGPSASWIPPEPLRDTVVKVSVSGQADGQVVCPASPVDLNITELGLGWDTHGLPSACYAGISCQGTALLVRPTSSIRARVDAMLADPATQVILYDGAEVISTSAPSPDDRYAWDRRYDIVRQAAWRLEIRSPAGSVELPMHVVDIRAPLVVSLTEAIDFGTHPVGTPWADLCQVVDFSGTPGAVQHRWKVELVGHDGGAAAPVIAFRNALGQVDRIPLTAPAEIASLDPDRPMLDLCLESSGCAACAAPDGVALRITPLTPEFADQARVVRLTWSLLAVDWLLCQAWWLIPLTVGTGLAVLVYGWIRPHRFPPSASVRVASNLPALKRCQPVVLVDLPGSGPGWYRDARLGLHGSGDLSGTRGALVVLRATAGGVQLIGSGLEVHDRRTDRWSAVTDHPIATANQIYRAGAVMFRVEV